MLAASTERGLAVKCNPATGSVDKHLLYSTDDGVPLRVNAVQVEGQRILWGFNPGYITMTTRPKSVVGRQLRVFAEFHQGAVTALALPAFAPDIALSAGEDGAIKIWVVPTVSCAKTFVGIVDTPTCLEVTRDYRIVAGYANGTIVIWNIRVDQLVKDFREQLRRRDVGDRTPPAVETTNSTTNIFESRRVIAPATAETSTPVQAIKHDLTHYGSHEVSKYKMTTGERTGVYGWGHDIGTITCMEWDVAPPTETGSLQAAMKLRTKMAGATSTTSTTTKDPPYMAQAGASKNSSQVMMTRLLVTGDTAGTVCIWDGDATSIDGRKVRPLRILHGHLAPISALFVDSFKVVSGSDDGWIRIWDPLTGSLVNVLGNKIPKNAPVDRNDVSVMRVTNLHCDDYRGVATIGHQVKTWDFSPNKQMLNKRNLRRNNVRVGAGDSRQLHYEIKQEWKESAEAIEQERQEREREAKELNKMTLGGLSDEEMLAYAVMLSQEQKGGEHQNDCFAIEEGFISNSNSGGGSSSSNNNNSLAPTTDYIDEDDEELMMAMIASLEMSSTGQNSSNDGGSSNSNTTSSSSNSSTSLPEDLTEWPTVADGNENRKWQKSSTVRSRNIWNDTQTRITSKAQHNSNNDNDNDENDDELQYVLRMSQKEF
ncbi:WD40-repeat-containing domain protein [Zychaea mexicana]|uniref:WD40-repeat-containing domain protein n=1 Tax=Zychaea mexicana TaxID=64656 RepID=UPI0022FDD85C|nr:WD40-repeat-containing domain protein [Zychaea mexicana]KAI9495258.1 WD40-repeat-containing domain protein [Zychaea mexicana]